GAAHRRGPGAGHRSRGRRGAPRYRDPLPDPGKQHLRQPCLPVLPAGRRHMTGPPTLDGRDAQTVAAELDAVRAGFTAEWPPRAGGPGQALLDILARYAELVIGQLDQAPGKAFLAFLGTMGVNLLPPRAARAPLVFEVADQSPVDPFLPADSEVAVASMPTLP